MKKQFDVTSASLHILAMAIMVLDHMWGTWIVRNQWFTTVGRIAFPIFAFLLVEGFTHTKNIKKYILRMLAFALISEIPFDLMHDGMAFNPTHQNVMWTFLVGLLVLWALDSLGKKWSRWLKTGKLGGKLKYYSTMGGMVLLLGVVSMVLCIVAMTDYAPIGIFTILTFYVFRGKKWWCYLGQFALLYWLNMEVMGGYCIIVNVFGHELELVQQGFALVALIPIWLYRGRQGYHAKWFQYANYAFYPAHCLILYVVKLLLSGSAA